jgi:hypothetical protein
LIKIVNKLKYEYNELKRSGKEYSHDNIKFQKISWIPKGETP